jgi:glycopeptide antibiotics resistance protein
MIRFLKLLFVFGYISLLLYTVFFARRRNTIIRENVEQNINWIPFKSIANNFYANILNGDSFVKKWFFFTNVFGNIFLFIPFPLVCFFLGFKLRNGSIEIIGVVLSILIEAIQGLFVVGIPDIDDVLLNAFGIYIGIWVLHISKTKIIIRTDNRL